MRPTTKLCGEPFNKGDPNSPRCIVALSEHAGRPHSAIRPDGTKVDWEQKPPAPKL